MVTKVKPVSALLAPIVHGHGHGCRDCALHDQVCEPACPKCQWMADSNARAAAILIRDAEARARRKNRRRGVFETPEAPAPEPEKPKPIFGGALEKSCRTCKEVKPTAEFQKRGEGRDCLACGKAYREARRGV